MESVDLGKVPLSAWILDRLIERRGVLYKTRGKVFWTKGKLKVAKGVLSRAQRVQMLVDLAQNEECQTATSEICSCRIAV